MNITATSNRDYRSHEFSFASIYDAKNFIYTAEPADLLFHARDTYMVAGMGIKSAGKGKP